MTLSEADATGGQEFHELDGQGGGMLIKLMYRRQLSIWRDGNFFQFQVDSTSKVLKMGRRATLAAAKKAVEAAARPSAPA